MYQTTLIGNIGNDAIVAQFNDRYVINFSVAVNESYLDKDKIKQIKTYWLDASYWVKKETIADYLKKGQTVWIRGTIDLKTWQGSGGEFKAGLSLRVEELELIGGKKEDPAPPAPPIKRK